MKVRESCLSEKEICLVLEGALDDDEAVNHHLEECLSCRERVELELANVYVEQTNPETQSVALDTQKINTTPDDLDQPVPSRIGRFEIIGVLGTGGMGVVYKARDSQLGRICAIKTVRHPHLLDADRVRRFKQESISTATLSHPGIVKIFEVAEFNGQLFQVQEFIDGKNLTELRKQGNLKPVEIAEILRQSATAAHHAHLKNIVHRDIKPANLIRSVNGQTLLVDFGLAKDLTINHEMTGDGTVVGTLGFMSPEQTFPNSEIAPSSDIYSLGGVLYFLLTGRPPFESLDLMATLEQIRHSDPVPPRSLDQSIPIDLQSICLKCLEKHPARRYPSAEALSDDLQRFQSGTPTVARPVNRIKRLARWSTRNPSLAALITLSLLLVLGIAIASPIFAAREIRLGELRKKQALADQQARHDRELIEQQKNLTASWVLRFLMERAWQKVHRNQHFSNLFKNPDDLPPEKLSFDTDLVMNLRKDLNVVVDNQFNGYHELLDFERSPDERWICSVNAAGLVSIWDSKSGLHLKDLTSPPWIDKYGLHRHYWSYRSKFPQGKETYCSDICWSVDSKSIYACTYNGKIIKFDREGKLPAETVVETTSNYTAIVRHANSTIAGDAEGGLSFFKDGKLSTRIRFGEQRIDDLRRVNQRTIVAQTLDAIYVIDTTEREQVSRIVSDTPIFDFDFWLENRRLNVMVCGPSPNLTHYRIGDDGQVDRIQSILVAEAEGDGFQSIDRHSTDGSLLLLDEFGNFIQIADTGKIQNFGNRRIRNRQQQDFFTRLEKNGIHPPQRNKLTRIRWTKRGDFPICVAGCNAGFSYFRFLNSKPQPPISQIRLDLRHRQELCYLSEHPRLLWSLGTDGSLCLIDTDSSKILDRIQAHSNGAKNGILEVDGELVTCGSDGNIRSWIHSENRIRSGTVQIETGLNLCSLAVDPGMSKLASVTLDGHLWVWSLEEKRRIFFENIEASEGELVSGKVDFNLDGSMLCASGLGQVCTVFDTANWQRLYRLDVSSLGATAVQFSPENNNRILVGDHYRTSRFDFPLNGGDIARTNYRDELKFSTVDSCLSDDYRRIVFLDRNGLLRFFESTNLLPVLTIRAPLTRCASLCCSPNGGQIAISNELGEIVILHRTQPDLRARLSDFGKIDPKLWVGKEIFRKDEQSMIDLNGTDIQLDRDGNIKLACFVDDGKKPDQLGKILLVSESGESSEEELVHLGIPDLNHQNHRIGFRYRVTADHEFLVLRQKSKTAPNNYASNIFLGTRERTTKNWSQEKIISDRNIGFFPVFRLAQEGGVRDIYFQSVENYNLAQASRSAKDGEWTNRFVGKLGDGINVTQGVEASDLFYFATRCSRFNGDYGYFVVVVFDKTGELIERLTVPSKFIRIHDSNFGHLLGVTKENRVMKFDYANKRWEEAMDVPLPHASSLMTFDVDKQGEFWGIYRTVEKELVLLNRTASTSSPSRIGSFAVRNIHKAFLKFHENKPVVVMSSLRDGTGSITAWRPSAD